MPPPPPTLVLSHPRLVLRQPVPLRLPVSTSAEVDDEGFITVANKKSRSRAVKSGNDFVPTSHPAPRPSVTVARPSSRQAVFPPFRMVQHETFATTYDAVAALEEEFPNFAKRNFVDGKNFEIP